MSGTEAQFLTDYVTVAAATADQVITNKKGTVLQRVILIPANTSPGEVSFQEGAAGTNRVIFAGGALSVNTLTPIVVELGIRAISDGFRLSTGADISAVVVGKFNAA